MISNHLIKLHTKIVWRILVELGIVRLIICLLIGIVGFIYLFSFKNSLTGLVTVLCFIWIVIWNLDSSRKDKRLLRMIGASKNIYLIECILLSLPFLILWGFSPWKFLIIIHVIFLLALVFGNINFKIPTFYFPIQKMFIPTRAFEWISGWRQNFFYFLIIYLLTLSIGYYEVTIPIAIFLFSLIASSFYKVCESHLFLEVFEFSSSQFLIYKLRQSVLVFCLCCLPLTILFLLLRYNYWHWLIMIMAASIIILINAVLTKYAYYKENRNLHLENILVVSFTIIGLVIPYLIPLCLLSVFWLFKKAKKNLTQYLYAFN